MRVEAARLAALRSLDILDCDPEEPFDRVARVARELLQVPVAKISLVDRFRTWPLAAVGVGRVGVPREATFCHDTIACDGPMVIPDVAADPLFGPKLEAKAIAPYRFYAGVPLTSREGFKLGALCCMAYEPRDPSAGQIAALEDLGRMVVEAMELRRIARSDSLTGALARGAFIESANRDVALSRRHGRALACILFDIDHFKSVNDTHGHAAGDHVLRKLSAICAQDLRQSDYIGRLGGEEFAIILRETDASAARLVAERLRRSMAREEWAFGEVGWSVSASFGVAELSATVATVDTLLARADAALYAAKKAGRNRTVLDGQPPRPGIDADPIDRQSPQAA